MEKIVYRVVAADGEARFHNNGKGWRAFFKKDEGGIPHFPTEFANIKSATTRAEQAGLSQYTVQKFIRNIGEPTHLSLF